MSDDQPTKSVPIVTASQMISAINDIHLAAIAARLGGNERSIMLEIEHLTEDILERVCNERADDTVVAS